VSTWLAIGLGALAMLVTVATVVCVAAAMLSSQCSRRLGE
jgi:hypothetical protein